MVYKLSMLSSSDYIRIGDKVKIGDDIIIITEILQVLFEKKRIHFHGVKLKDLD